MDEHPVMKVVAYCVASVAALWGVIEIILRIDPFFAIYFKHAFWSGIGGVLIAVAGLMHRWAAGPNRAISDKFSFCILCVSGGVLLLIILTLVEFTVIYAIVNDAIDKAPPLSLRLLIPFVLVVFMLTSVMLVVLKAAGWPKAMGIEARGIVAVTTYLEARDFADNQPASYDNLQKREYHHVFPDALLQAAEIPSFLALNCALITWKTNRVIGRKDPLAYLKERVDWAGESTVRQRMKTHLIDYDLLAKGGHGDLQQQDSRDRLKKDFESFLDDRAGHVAWVVEYLAAGKQPDLYQLWQAPAAVEGV